MNVIVSNTHDANTPSVWRWRTVAGMLCQVSCLPGARTIIITPDRKRHGFWGLDWVDIEREIREMYQIGQAP